MRRHAPAPRAADAPADAAVRATNDDAFISKQCALRAGYFADPYLEALSQHLSPRAPAPWRPPIINRGTAARVAFKTALVDSFLSRLTPADAAHRGPAQIVSLGAGYDSLPFTLAQRAAAGHDPPLHYVELDLTPVVSAKAAAVHAEPALRALFTGLQPRAAEGLDGVAGRKGSCHYSLAACDLRDAAALTDVLHAVGLRRDCPTLILTEIVLIYLEPAFSDAVIRATGEYFVGQRVFVNIEHVHPDDAFGAQMVSNIATRGSPLLGIQKYPTLRAQKGRFVAQGWAHVETLTMLDAFQRKYSREETIRLNRIEILDEVEEWNMIMEHYCIVVAVDSCNEEGAAVLAQLLESSFRRT